MNEMKIILYDQYERKMAETPVECELMGNTIHVTKSVTIPPPKDGWWHLRELHPTYYRFAGDPGPGELPLGQINTVSIQRNSSITISSYTTCLKIV